MPASVIKEIDHINAALPRADRGRALRRHRDLRPGGARLLAAKAIPPASCASSTTRRWPSPTGRGNNRIDGFRNIVRDPRIALLFLIPGVGETLRVNGRAAISVDPELMRELRHQRQAAALRADRARRERLLPLLEGDRALEAVGRGDQDRPQEPALDRQHRRRTEQGQGSAARITTARRPSASRRSFTSSSGAVRRSTARSSRLRSAELRRPPARSSRRMCAGTGAVTFTGGLFLEIGTVTSRACRCSGGPAGARRAAVDAVADDRKAHLGAMHAQLMRAPGQRLEREPGECRRRGPSPSTSSPTAGRAGRASSTSRASRRAWPSAMSMRPSSAAGAPSTTAQ